MGVCPCSRPSHRERAEVRDLQSVSDVNSSHGAWALNQQVCALTCLPGSLEQIVDPTAELSGQIVLVPGEGSGSNSQ